MDNYRVDINLRSHQANYLEYLAERDETSASAALRVLLETYGNALLRAPRIPPRKIRKNVTLKQVHMDILGALGLQWGVKRAEATRRLLDEARRMDGTLGD